MTKKAGTGEAVAELPAVPTVVTNVVGQSPEIKTMALAVIKPYWRNPRDNHEAVAKVKASIERYGYNQLIAVDEENVIIAGHTRYRALQELGWPEVSVIIIRHLTDHQKKAYRIADNKTSEFSTWTPDLAAELREIGAADMQEFFVEDLGKMLSESVGGAAADVTENDVKETSDALENRFEGDNNGSTTEVICPNCAHQFHVRT